MRLTVVAMTVAFALTLAYGVLLQPQWEPQLDDQFQYLSLARGFVEHGEFTRARSDEAFFAETYRLPGYPLFLAPLCIGGCDRWRIAVAQGAGYAAIVLITYLFGRRLLGVRRATVAAWIVATYVPFAYLAALPISDPVGAALTAAGVYAWFRALDTRRSRWAIAAGALLGWAGLVRPALLLLPLALVLVAVVRRTAALAAACLLAVGVVVAPYVAYSEINFARLGGGTSGLVLWLGVFEGRNEASLDAVERAQVAQARDEIAAFDAMPDRDERARVWLTLDDALGARARTLIAHDPGGWVARVSLRTLVLFGGDVPLRGGAGGDVTAGLAAAELAMTALGVVGLIQLARARGGLAWIPLVVVLYVWLTAAPFATEGRYAFPARPFLAIGIAALGIAHVSPNARRHVAPLP